MKPIHAVVWGFGATVVLTTILSVCRGLGLTRMDMPLMLGTVFTESRDRAKWYGFFAHVLNGWAFAFVYLGAIAFSGLHHWWFGALIGLVHAGFLLTVVMSALPAIHPRMADEERGPDPTRLLEPPGFLALNYGIQTPVATVIAHVIYGTILGLFMG
jgi:hypothetical protein